MMLSLALLWIVVMIAVAGLLRRAQRELLAARAHAVRLRCCAENGHRDTLDIEIDGLPELRWRCLDCGECVTLGTAFFSGSNRKARRRV